MCLFQQPFRRHAINTGNISAQFHAKLLTTFIRFLQVDDGRQR